MIQKRQRRIQPCHLALLVNREAARYNPKAISQLIDAIRAKGGSYTLFEPESALDLLRQAEVVCGLRRATQNLSRPYERGGKVTGLVACGGDGTFNLVARAGLAADLPVGHYPLGKLNNIAKSIYGTGDPAKVIPHLLSSKVRATDTAKAGNLPFFGSIGLGFMARLNKELENGSVPRFGIGWSRLATRAAAMVEIKRVVLKVDSFRFEIHPSLLNINLLSHSVGLPLSPASIADDGQAEVLFDTEPDTGFLSSFTRAIHKRKYIYGDEVRLYRGKVISFQPVKGRTICLDGELVTLPTETVEVRIGEKKLQVMY